MNRHNPYARIASILLTLSLAMLVVAPFAISLAEEVVYDYADVRWVRPLTRQVSVPIAQRMCDPGQEEMATQPGYLHSRVSGASLADAIREEYRQLGLRTRCRVVTEAGYEEEIVGYRVGYEYAGTEYERTLSFDPGQRLRVRIEIEAGR